MLSAGRNQTGLTERQIAYCVDAWEALCGDQPIELDVSEASRQSSQTRFVEVLNKVALTRFQVSAWMQIRGCPRSPAWPMSRPTQSGSDRDIAVPRSYRIC
jgi:hypothetical protein